MANGRSASAAESGGPAPPEPRAGSSNEAGTGTVTLPPSHRRTWIYYVVAIVAAIAVVAAGYAFAEMSDKTTSTSSGRVIVPAGTLYSLPPDQYNAVIFAQKSPATVAGTITNVGGLQMYLMSPAEYETLVVTYNLTGYEWTSGPVPSDTYYQLEVTIPTGIWDLVFANSVSGNTTAIGIYSNLVETS